MTRRPPEEPYARDVVARVVHAVPSPPTGRRRPDVRVLVGATGGDELVHDAARGGAVVDAQFSGSVPVGRLARLAGVIGRCTVPAGDRGARDLAAQLRRVRVETGVLVERHVPVEAAYRLLDDVDAVTVVCLGPTGLLEGGTLGKVLALREAIDERAGRRAGRPISLVVDAVTAPAASLSVAAGADALVVADHRDTGAIERAVQQELSWAR